MSVVGAEALAVRGEPGADYLVFGAGEEYVAVFCVSDRMIRGVFAGLLCPEERAHLIWVKARS